MKAVFYLELNFKKYFSCKKVLWQNTLTIMSRWSTLLICISQLQKMQIFLSRRFTSYIFQRQPLLPEVIHALLQFSKKPFPQNCYAVMHEDHKHLKIRGMAKKITLHLFLNNLSVTVVSEHIFLMSKKLKSMHIWSCYTTIKKNFNILLI